MILRQTMGHNVDIWCRLVSNPNGMHWQCRRNKRWLCGHVLERLNCFPLRKLTEMLKAKHARALTRCPQSTAMDCHCPTCTRPAPTQRVFERANVSLGVGLCPLGADRCRTEHLTVLWSVESSRMPPRSTCGIEVM